MKIFDFIQQKILGHVRCRVCNKYCEPSILMGNMCSIECYVKEKGEKE